MSLASAWAERCERWVEQLRDDNGPTPTGLFSVVEDLVSEYGVLQVLEATQRSIAAREVRAERLANATVALCEAARIVHPPDDVLPILNERTETACAAAVRVLEDT